MHSDERKSATGASRALLADSTYPPCFSVFVLRAFVPGFVRTFVRHVLFLARVVADVLGEHWSMVVLEVRDEAVEDGLGHHGAADRRAEIDGQRSDCSANASASASHISHRGRSGHDGQRRGAVGTVAEKEEEETVKQRARECRGDLSAAQRYMRHQLCSWPHFDVSLLPRSFPVLRSPEARESEGSRVSPREDAWKLSRQSVLDGLEPPIGVVVLLLSAVWRGARLDRGPWAVCRVVAARDQQRTAVTGRAAHEENNQATASGPQRR